MSRMYRLGDYEVDSLRRQIWRDGEIVPLAQKPFDVLLYLVDRVGQVVSKEELMEAIWPQAFVEEANLTQSIFLLRKAFGDKASGSRYIITVPGRGYQMGVSPLPLVEAAASGGAAAEAGDDREMNAGPPSGVIQAEDMTVGTTTVKTTRTGVRDRRAVVFALCAVVLVLLCFAGWRSWRSRSRLEPTYRLSRLTNSGDVQAAAISASGRYVGYVSKDALGSYSLFVSDLRSRTSQVILHDDLSVLDDVTFSPGDLFIYYRSHLKSDPDQMSSEHRLPLFGGEPTEVVRDIDGRMTFVGDGKRVCFWRETSVDHFAFLTADAESGKDERTVATAGRPEPVSAACAPDGERAAISTETGEISMLDFKTGQRRAFSPVEQGKQIYDDLAWKSDGSALMATVITPFNQSWSLLSISYPEGERQQITRDIDSYRSPGMTADGATIVARQSTMNAQFQSFDLPLLGAAAEVSSFPWTDFLGWSGDDTIVGAAIDGGIKKKVVKTGLEHSVQTQSGVRFLQPNGCGEGALVAAGSDGTHKEISIWHMNADGSGLKQLTHGAEDILPACTPDGQWVLYADNSFQQRATVYRVAAKGGVATKVGEGSVWFAISQRGDKLAWTEHDEHGYSLVVADLMSGRRLGVRAIPASLRVSRNLSFSADDQHVLVISRGNLSDSVYDVPLDGSVPIKQIEFRGSRVAALAVSPSGKSLGVVTIKPVSDVVLLQRAPR